MERKDKRIKIRIQSYYLYNDGINLCAKGINIYYAECTPIKKIKNSECIYSLYPLCLRVNYANGYIEEKMEIII